MAIQTIQQILINDSPQIFGGYIYSASLSVGVGELPTQLSLSIISEDGNYLINAESIANPYCNPYTIKIGSNLTFSCYLDEYALTKSPGGNTLNLKFIDTSNILDKIYVGLYKKHGITSTENLILVGKEINFCSNDVYGSTAPLQIYDPCHPCVDSQKQNNISNYVDCLEKSRYEIMDVRYNFTELLSKLPIEVKNATDPNPKYLTQHTGLLRDVLSLWCRDFGWFYYWDNGRIVFRDLRNIIEVSANITNFCPNVLEYTESYSMKNSVKTATITNFSRPGDPARLYDCQTAKYIIASTLQQTSAYSMPLSLTDKIDTIAAGLSHYNNDLRDLYYWYIKYQMYNSSNYIAGKKLEKIGMTILSGQIVLDSLNGDNTTTFDDANLPSVFSNFTDSDLSISPLDTSNATKVASVGKTEDLNAIKANYDFYQCFQLLDPESQWKVLDKPRNYFFFAAEHDKTIDGKHLDEEKSFAQIFNKYAIYVPDSNDKFFEDYDFELDELCGINQFVNTGTVSYNFTPSNVTFFNTSVKGALAGEGTQMNDLPFAQFLSVLRGADSGTTSGSTLLPFKLIVVERGENSFTPNGSTELNGPYPAIRKESLLGKVSKYFPKELANKNNLRGEFVARLLSGASTDYKDRDDVFIYMGTAVSSTAFNLTKIDSYTSAATFGTLYNGKPLNKQINPTLQKTEIVYQYPELKCKIVGNNSYGSGYTLHAQKVVFATPISSFEYTEPTDALYGIVVEKIRQKRRIVEKVESFNTTNLDIDSDSCKYSKLSVNTINISDEKLRVLKQNDTICEFDKDKIKTIHEEFSANLAVTHTTPSISKTFKIAGIDLPNYTPSIDNGLISLEIGIDSSNAVYSVYEFGTRLMRLPGEEFLFSTKSDMLSNPGSYTNTVNYFPLKGQPNV